MDRDHAAEELAPYDIRPDLMSIVKLSALGFLVMMLALLTMAWQHQATAMIGIATSMLYLLGAMGTCLYRLGRLAR